MKYDKLSRRMFLQGAGKTTLAIPFLSSMAPVLGVLSPQKVLAATTSMKYIGVHSLMSIPHITTIPGFFNYDTGVYNNYNAAPWLQTHDNGIRHQNLSDIVSRHGKLSYSLDEKWNSYLNKVNIITNTHGYTQSHLHNTTNATCASSQDSSSGDYGNAHFHYSGDRVVASAIYGSTLPKIPVLLAGLTDTAYGSDNGWSYRVSHETINGVKQSHKTQNLNSIYNTLVSIGGVADPVQVNPKKRIVDLVLEDYKSVTQSRHISSADKTILSNVMDMWNDVSKLFTSDEQPTQQQSCSYPTLVQPTNAAEENRKNMQLVAIALACGVTNVVSYALHDIVDNLIGSNADNYHGITHDSRTNINNYYMQDGTRWRGHRFLEFIDILSNTPSSDGGSVFDSVVMTWNHEYSGWGHNRLGYTQFFASGDTAKFDLGQHIDANGAPINKLFVTSFYGMGLTPAQFEKNGVVGFGEYRPTSSTMGGVFWWPKKDGWQNTNFTFNYNNAANFMTTAAKRAPYHFFKG